MFSTLESSSAARMRRAKALACGTFVEVLVIAGAILLGVFYPQELPVAKHYVLAWLPALTPPDPPLPHPRRRVVKVIVPKRKLAETAELVAPPMPELKVPKVQPTIPPMPLPVPPPPPPVAQPSPPPKPREPAIVHTGTLDTPKEKVTTKRPVEQVQTGGFGSSQGLPGRAQGGSPGDVPKVGSFGLPDGSGVGNGAGGRHGVPGVVASAGFSGVVADKESGPRADENGEPKVAVGGFEKARQIAPTPPGTAHGPAPEVFQPVEILFKPSPVYTEEARRLKIQGEVVLSVVFQANGAISVTGVVRPLGHGLDMAAEKAATQIRFKPAMRDGKPADFPATLRIQFRLADQSS